MRNGQGDDDNGATGPAISLEPNNDTNSSGSLGQPRKIMSDVSVPLHRRLDAAETVISFELAPGAAADVDPDLIASAAYKFLQNVVGSPQTPDALKFKPLRLLASVENQRAQIRSTSASLAARRELLLRLVNSSRAKALRDAGCWLPPDDSWVLLSSDQFDWPEGWLSSWTWPSTSSLAAGLEHANAADAEALKARLLAVVATNRPDLWRRFADSKTGLDVRTAVVLSAILGQFI